MDFKKNMGAQDKKARLALAGVLIIVGLFTNLGALESLMWLVTVVLVATSIMNFCPAYCLIGKSSCGEGSCCPMKKKDDKEEPKKEEAGEG